jgi:hypothetical protein
MLKWLLAALIIGALLFFFVTMLRWLNGLGKRR